MPLVSEKSDQSILLSEAGLVLLSTGRPKEAEKPLKTAIDIDIEVNKIAYASVGYLNLAKFQFWTGELERGLSSAKKALDTAEKAKSDKKIRNSKAYLAWILHLLEKGGEASKEFRQADELQIMIDPAGDRLYSTYGVFYADFFISLKKIDEAFKLTKQNLGLVKGIIGQRSFQDVTAASVLLKG